MINSKKLTLSIVIPVYNEEDYIADCLDSIAAQSEAPDEVIIVDNNCTDRSIQIARNYPFVKIIQEKNQHQAFAQKTGFDCARSDILGRIDADTVLPQDWIKKVKQIFASNPGLDALTGGPEPYDVLLKRMAVSVFMFYHTLASRIAGTQMIWGANAALRKSAWLKIRNQVLQRADIWEDYDLSLLIGGQNLILFIEGIDVGSSFRKIDEPFLKQVKWHFRAIRTFYYHSSPVKTVLLLPCWVSLLVFYPVVLLHSRFLKPLFGFREQRREILESTAIVD